MICKKVTTHLPSGGSTAVVVSTVEVVVGVVGTSGLAASGLKVHSPPFVNTILSMATYPSPFSPSIARNTT